MLDPLGKGFKNQLRLGPSQVGSYGTQPPSFNQVIHRSLLLILFSQGFLLIESGLRLQKRLHESKSPLIFDPHHHHVHVSHVQFPSRINPYLSAIISMMVVSRSVALSGLRGLPHFVYHQYQICTLHLP